MASTLYGNSHSANFHVYCMHTPHIHTLASFLSFLGLHFLIHFMCINNMKVGMAWEQGYVHTCTMYIHHAHTIHTPCTHHSHTMHNTMHTPCTHHVHAHTMHIHTPFTHHSHTMHMHTPCTHHAHTMHTPCTHYAHIMHTWLISSTTLKGQEVMPCRAMR